MKNLCVIVVLFLVVMLGGCSSQKSIAQSDNASKTSSPSSNAAISSAAAAKSSANVPGSPSTTPESSAAGKAIDPASLLIGTWINVEQQLQVNFSRSGYCTVKNNGALIGRSTYSTDAAGSNSVTVTIEGSSTKIVFADENHMQRNDVSYVRVSENEMVNSVTALKKLLIGAWQTTDSCLVFDANGTLTVKQVGNPDMVSTYTIEGLDKTSMTITITDPAGTSSSKVASFTGNDTLVIGEADYTRVSTSLSPQASPSVGVTANPNVSAAKDFNAVGADLLKSDGLGALKVSMAESDLVKLLGEPDSKTTYELWGADGLEHSDWAYNKLGLKINMARQPKSTGSIVNSISATSPCSLATKRSIKIGTPKAQVLSAYADSIDPAANKDTDTRIVLGSIYGGIIINIENGAVKNIFIGASAE